MKIEIEMVEGVDSDELHKLTEAIKLITWDKEIKTVESITETV